MVGGWWWAHAHTRTHTHTHTPIHPLPPRRYIYAPDNVEASADCDTIRKYSVRVVMDGDKVSFQDDKCKMLSVANTLPHRFNESLFVYFGADQDDTKKQSQWNRVRVAQPIAPPALPHDGTVLMDDRFDFNHALMPDMWTAAQTTGLSDDGCGAVSGSGSLRFFNKGSARR